jgi:hypothetical protein
MQLLAGGTSLGLFQVVGREDVVIVLLEVSESSIDAMVWALRNSLLPIRWRQLLILDKPLGLFLAGVGEDVVIVLLKDLQELD